MPITKEILEKHPNEVFVETGTYHGEAVALALNLGFTTIHTSDVDAGCIAGVKQQYANNKNVHITLGDSQAMLEKLVPKLNSPTTFWLDAHPLIVPMPLFNPDFPLLRELLTIKRLLKGTGHVILMDDMRTYSPYEKEILVFAMKQLFPDWGHGFYADRLTDDDVYWCRGPE